MAPPARRWMETLPRSDRERSLANLPQEHRHPTRCRPSARDATHHHMATGYDTASVTDTVPMACSPPRSIQWSPLESNHNGRARDAPLRHAGSSSGAPTTNIPAMRHKPMVPKWTIAERCEKGSALRRWETIHAESTHDEKRRPTRGAYLGRAGGAPLRRKKAPTGMNHLAP